MAFFVAMAIAFRDSSLLRGFSYSAVIFAAVSLAIYCPQYFLYAGNFKLSKLILPLLQIIMFGMGTELSLKQFRDVIRMPKGILIGVVCHYTIMPATGFALAAIFSFPKEIAAGIVLSETPSAGTPVTKRSAVNLVLSSGPAKVTVPNVVDLKEAAANLFSYLSRLDASGARAIAVMAIPERGLGRAINDRLRRAAAPRPPG